MSLLSPLKPLLILLLVLAGADVSAEQKLVVGLMTELSGPSAPNGTLCRQGLEVARHLYAPGDEINGTKISFVYGDTQGQGPAGISEFRRLTEAEHAIAVVANRSQVCMAVNPISQAKAVPLIGIVGHSDFTRTNKYSFRFWPTAEQEGRVIAERILSDGFRSVAVLTTQDEWTISLTKAFAKAFQAGGGSINFEEHIEPHDLDFGTIVNRIRKVNASAVFLNLTLVHMGTALKRLREYGISSKLYANYWASNPDTIAVAGAATKGVTYNGPDPEHDSFVAGLKALFPTEKPMASQYSCYLGLATLLQTLKLHPEVRDSATLVSALSSQREVELLDGKLLFDGRDAQVPIRFGVL